MHLLLVCSGNICRSPTAERLVRAYAAEHALAGLTAESSGTGAVVGSGMDPRAAAVLTELGGDPAGFVARRLTVEQVRAADLVLTMTAQHRARVLELAPGALRRTFTLREAARLLPHAPAGDLPAALVPARALHGLGSEAEDDVADPYRRGGDAHARSSAVITVALGPLLDRLRQQLGSSSPEQA